MVTDAGYLTLDNWHNTGYGKVVALYAPDGKPCGAMSCTTCFGFRDREIQPQRVVNCVAKGCRSLFSAGRTTFNVMINDTGAGLIFDNGGAYQYCETRDALF